MTTVTKWALAAAVLVVALLVALLPRGGPDTSAKPSADLAPARAKAPCRTELPVLQAYAAEPGAVRVLGVQVQSPAKDGLELLSELGVHLPSVFDGEGRSGPVRDALKVPSSLPASYLVTAGGEVRFIANPRSFVNTVQVHAAVEGAS